jgi:Domain of unknown function (DUF4485)
LREVLTLFFAERTLGLQWLNKLQAPITHSNLQQRHDEARLRNDFIYALSQSCFHGQLWFPFNAPPPAGPLLSIRGLLPSDEELEQNIAAARAEDNSFEESEIFRRAPESGKFLKGQPLPRSGIFCYVTVVSPPPP